MWVLGTNIVIGLYVLDMWSVMCVPYVVLASNIAIRVYVLNMWSVLCILYGGGEI